MNQQSINHIFQMTISSWEKFTQDQRESCSELMKMEEKDAETFCTLYFDRYAIIHELGHLIRHFLRLNKNKASKGALEEYYASLFAVKYLQYRGDYKYLTEILEWIDIFYTKYSVGMEFNLTKLNCLYHRYTSDLKTLSALHFLCLKEANKSSIQFPELVRRHTEGKISNLNNSIIFQSGISGEILMNECLQVVFGMHHECPSLNLARIGEIRANSLSLKRGASNIL